MCRSYDDAVVISGSTEGMQGHFRMLHPEALYMHCNAHELNLGLCHTWRAVSVAGDFFLVCWRVCILFLSTSLLHHHLFEAVQWKPLLKLTKLVQLSTTHFNAILGTLTFECLSAIGSPTLFSTLYLQLMFQSILSLTEGLHKIPLNETLDQAEAFLCKQGVCDTLKCKHTDVFATSLHDRTKALYHTHNIPEQDMVKRQGSRLAFSTSSTGVPGSSPFPR